MHYLFYRKLSYGILEENREATQTAIKKCITNLNKIVYLALTFYSKASSVLQEEN